MEEYEDRYTGYEKDKMTGLFTQRAFLTLLGERLKRADFVQGSCMVAYFDVQRFKLINNMFGMEEGDRLLRCIADAIREAVDGRGIGCHLHADRFALAICAGREETERCIAGIFDAANACGLPFEVQCNAGLCVVDDAGLEPDAAVDRAIIAQQKIKGSYTQRCYYYSEELRRSLFSEQEIAGMMAPALAGKQFVVYYQPQYNHTTGLLVGAEALVRWCHPEKGLIPPDQFIPVFERNGFISRLDLYVFEQVCSFQKRCLNAGIPVVPVSANLTRGDIFSPGFIDRLEAVRAAYQVPARLLRLELTESSALGGSRFLNEAIRKLHALGYKVEMDDFGSGYSSLNILKDVEFDVVKLDMRFLEKRQDQGSRGGIILSAIVRMLNWLQLPMIAEGVETMEQADFLQSIGCMYIQGFLYSRPVPEENFEALLRAGHTGSVQPSMSLIRAMNANAFWDSDSLETLIFSNYVGAAAILDYHDGEVELLRVNRKYLRELGMNQSEKETVNGNLLLTMDETGRAAYEKMLAAAIETGEEQECETWRVLRSDCCGEERICIRTTVQLIGKSSKSRLFHAMIRNITAEKKYYTNILDSERRFKMASEQVNIYYWEYTVATHEMRPCFRCMRDLGLPALLTNYPDSAIEMGIFPPEVADMYRDWHRQIAEGVPSLEAVIPLTVGRVPFHVRYTTEFDENGHPVKAYGSAALVVPGEQAKA